MCGSVLVVMFICDYVSTAMFLFLHLKLLLLLPCHCLVQLVVMTFNERLVDELQLIALQGYEAFHVMPYVEMAYLKPGIAQNVHA